MLLAADKPIDAASVSRRSKCRCRQATNRGCTQRADIQLFGANVTAADRVVRDSWKDWVPNATASLQPQWIHPAGLFAPSRTWQAVIGVDIPLFDGGERRAVKRQREIALDTSNCNSTT